MHWIQELQQGLKNTATEKEDFEKNIFGGGGKRREKKMR